MTEQPMDDSTPRRPPTWHSATDVLARYADLALDDARSASVEQHLLGCSRCRAQLASLWVGEPAGQAAHDAMWLDLIDAVDAPRPAALLSGLRRFGLPERIANVVAAAPSLRFSWLASMIVVLIFAVVSTAQAEANDALLLILAPLVPLAGIGTAFGAGVDPVHELVRTSPTPSSRVFLYRSIAVLCTALPLTVAGSLLLPFDGIAAIGWLLPALGLAGLTLALSTWIEPRVAAAAAGSSWLLVVLATWSRTARLDGPRMAATLPFRPAGQALFALLALAGCLVFWRRLERFDAPDLQAEV
jgi:hypothetical protein